MLVIIAGTGGSGKTTLAQEILKNSKDSIELLDETVVEFEEYEDIMNKRTDSDYVVVVRTLQAVPLFFLFGTDLVLLDQRLPLSEFKRAEGALWRNIDLDQTGNDTIFRAYSGRVFGNDG